MVFIMWFILKLIYIYIYLIFLKVNSLTSKCFLLFKSREASKWTFKKPNEGQDQQIDLLTESFAETGKEYCCWGARLSTSSRSF